MPWTAADAERHAKGLTAHQKTVWARVANSALRACSTSGGDTAECEGKAIRQANAVAKRAPAKSVKMDGDGILSILAIPFGGPLEGMNGKGVDTDGEYFSPDTDLCLDWFPTQRPLLYEHGRDDTLEVTPIGKVDVTSAEKDEAGWWFRAQVDKSNRYWAAISQMIEDDLMFASSGSMPHLVKRTADGEIKRWPWVELSLTPNPANLYAMVQPAEAKSHYKSAGITPPPIIDGDDARSYADLLDRLADDSGEFLDLTQRLAEGRVKVGRALSRSRREQLLTLASQWESGAADLRRIVEEAEAQAARATDDEEPQAGAEAPAAAAEGGTPEGTEGEPAGGKSTDDEQQEGKAAHADPELASIFAQFQTAEAFYGTAFNPGHVKRGRIVRT